MKNTNQLFLVFAFLISTNFIWAQQTEWCSSGKSLAAKFKNDPAFHQALIAQMNQLQQPDNSRAAATVYIPVVFHVVHNGDAIGTGENITDAQCISQIDALNKIYNFQDPNILNVPAVFQPLIADCNVKFCLAKFDENGNPTSGIVRHLMTQATWDTENDIDQTLKPATTWDNTLYLNIWSVRMGGQLVTDGVLAYATFPGFGPADQDGVVARYNTIGTTGSLLTGYNKGKTVAHEVGHWFGLFHTWGFDASCGDVGDFIADTPDQADLNFGCPTFPHVSCTAATGDMFMNYMDYTNDACSGMFTLGQATVMRNTLNGSRSIIKTASTQCYYNLDVAVKKIILPADSICSLNFLPVITIKNEGGTTIVSGNIYWQIDGGTAQQMAWNGSLGMQAEELVTLPTQNAPTGTHTFTVTFTEINSTPGDGFLSNNSKTDTFFAYNGGAGTPAPFSEGFESSFLPINWSIVNKNNDVTWVQNFLTGGYSNSAQSTSMNNLAHTTNPNFNKRDALITDAYDLTGITKPELKFDVAYAQYSATRTDSLNVYYSVDCGSNWIKVWNARGNTLATAPNQTTPFTPDNTQWKTVAVGLLPLANQPKVSFKFENVSGWGNVLYLDNINLQNNPSLSVNEIHKTLVKIFPNPASGLIAVRLSANHSFKKISLYNLVGEMIYETSITDNATIISTENFANGLYFIHLNGATESQTEKILIQR